MNALVTENIQEMENSGRGQFTDKTMHIKTVRSKRKVKPEHSISESISLKLLITFPPSAKLMLRVTTPTLMVSKQE